MKHSIRSGRPRAFEVLRQCPEEALPNAGPHPFLEPPVAGLG
ncbi:MAG: hypothetical protein KatS3mg058_4015 [Roseiflexus sp.]|nr:MAG: hypothetical protein KatS3mg058_4015 [Roseiflexus sp.]